MLILLDADNMSLHHLNQVRQWMAQEKAAKVRAEEEAQKKVRSGASLTGGYARQ
jgi:hypothetical protein